MSSKRDMCPDSSVVLRYCFTRKGGLFIEALRGTAPNGDLSVMMTNAMKALVHLVDSRSPNIPVEHDFLVRSFHRPKNLDSGFFTKDFLKETEGVFEIPLPRDFFEGLEYLQGFVRYENEDAAIRHVLLFAYHSERERRGIGYVH